MNNKKKIIYFLPYITGGVTSFVFNLLKFRPQSDIYYKVILYREKERKAANFEMKFNANEQIIFEYSAKENLYSIFRRLRKHISSENSYLVANDGLEIRMAWALKLKNPLIYIVHGDFEYYFKLAQIYENTIDKIITVSTFLNNKLYNIFSENCKNKIVTEYAAVPNIEILKKKKNEKKINIVFVGFIIKGKGVLFFDEICKKIIEKQIDFEFNIIGSGDLFDKVESQLSKYSNVKMIGQIDHYKVLEFLKKSDILLFPTYTEGMPVSLIEAMKCGCVPVVSDIPSGIPELVFDGKTGYKISLGDTKQFAEKITYLAQNQEIRIKISQNAKKLADKMFNPFEQAKKYEQLILNTKTENKTFKKLPLGRILNQPYLPNFFVKAIRSVIKHPKI